MSSPVVFESHGIRELGIGLVYGSGLAPLLHAAGTCGVVEVEPQSLWEKVIGPHGYQYVVNEKLLDEVACLPQPKLIHGIGQPLAGTTDDPVAYLPLLRSMADRLQAVWASEHLSFNRVSRGADILEVGFLLPPQQSPAAVRVAAHNISRYSAALARPVAFETGVNYLRPGHAELPDGQFFAAVAEHAQCGILLDLHNLWCNELNGRQRVCDALAQLPLDRIWEVHLAGGMPFRGYWLDSHSSVVPPALLELAATVIPRLSNLGALIFEVLPEHLDAIGLDGVQRQVETLGSLWALRPALRVPVRRAIRANGASASLQDLEEVRDSELRLYELITGDRAHDDCEAEEGLSVLRELIFEFRAGNLSKTARYTLTALLAGVGQLETRALLKRFFRTRPPDAYAAIEADNFLNFIRDQNDVLVTVPYLDQIVAFEAALLSARVASRTTELEWSVDPTALFEELDNGRLARGLPHTTSRMRVVAD